MSEPVYPAVSADLQVRLWARLQLLRPQYLSEGLTPAVSEIALETLDAELHQIVGGERLAPLTKLGLRGEQWYALPCVLTARP